jgi:hypothetical protein
MTTQEAIKQAEIRWGKKAAIRLRNPKRVGYIQFGAFFCVEGEGTTWEEAFAKADAKTLQDKRWTEEILKSRRSTR